MGKGSWEAEKVVYKFEFIGAEEFSKIIEEAAEIVYSDFCQLPEDSFFCASNDDFKPSDEAA